MRRTAISIVVLAIIILIAIQVIFGEEANTRITTTDQAEQSARKIFQKFNWPVDGNVIILKPQLGGKGRESRWRVNIGENYKAEFDGENGKLRSLFRFTEREFRKRNEDIININEKIASEKAFQYLTLAGIKYDDAKIVVNNIRINSPTPGGAVWDLVMTRTYQGYEFKGDTISVELDPQNGDLIGLGYNYDMPIPQSTVVKLSSNRRFQKLRIFCKDWI